MAVADRFCKQENKKKCVNEVASYLADGSKFLSPSDILGSSLFEKKDGGK